MSNNKKPLNYEDCHELVSAWRQIAADNTDAAARLNRLADQLEAILRQGEASFQPTPKRAKLLRKSVVATDPEPQSSHPGSAPSEE